MMNNTLPYSNTYPLCIGDSVIAKNHEPGRIKQKWTVNGRELFLVENDTDTFICSKQMITRH